MTIKPRLLSDLENHFGKPAQPLGLNPPSLEEAAAAREGRPYRSEQERNAQPGPLTPQQLAEPYVPQIDRDVLDKDFDDE